MSAKANKRPTTDDFGVRFTGKWDGIGCDLHRHPEGHLYLNLDDDPPNIPAQKVSVMISRKYALKALAEAIRTFEQTEEYVEDVEVTLLGHFSFILQPKKGT
jgi:hypothetical protein